MYLNVTFNKNTTADVSYMPSDATIWYYNQYNTIAISSIPTRSNYLFQGWYFDAACTQALDGNAICDKTADFTLYAKWEEITAPEMQSKADNYMACQGEVIKIEVEGLPTGYTYAVYTQPTGGTYSYSSDPTFFLKTTNSDEVAYVQAISNGTSVGDRIEVPVLASAFCGGSTTDQSCNGTLLYNEDFGGNSTSDPNYSSSDANFTSDMDFVAGGIPGRGEYGILKHIPEDFQGFTPVTNNSDHTHPGNINQGYFMFIDPSDLSMGHTVAETTISNLCDNTELTFSFWASDMWDNTHTEAQASTPKFDMQLINPETGRILVQTSVCTPARTAQQSWHQFGVKYTIPAGLHSVKFRLVNRENNGMGNDYGIDDIKVTFCGADIVQGNPDITVCEGDEIRLETTVTVSPNVIPTPKYKWQKTNTPNDESSWQDLAVKNVDDYVIDAATTNDAGYYRMFVADASNVAEVPTSSNCAIRTEEDFHVIVNPKRVPVFDNLQSSYCYGATVTLPTTSDNGIEGTWNPTEVNTTAQEPITYTFTPTDMTCAQTYSKEITIQSSTVATITATPTAICNGGTATLSVPEVTGNTYKWSTQETTASITVNAPNTYKVTVTAAGGCESQGEIDITQYDAMTPGAISISVTVCSVADTLVKITSATPASGGAPDGYYQWEMSSSQNFPTGDVTIITSNTDGYSVPIANSYHKYYRRGYVTDCGTVYTEPVYVINSGTIAPGAIQGEDQEYCAGAEVSKTVNVGTITVQSGAPYTVQWMTSTDNTNWTNAISIASSESDLSYTYTSTSFDADVYIRYYVQVEGCEPDTCNGVVYLKKNPLPVIAIEDVTSDNVICPSVGTQEITGKVTTATTANYTYTWSGGLTVTPATTTTAEVENTVTATIPATCDASYTVTLNVTDGKNCAAQPVSKTVEVKNTVTPTVTCANDVQQNTDVHKNYSTVTLPNPNYAGNCDATCEITYSPAMSAETGVSATNASGKYPIGTTTVTYTVTDVCNQENSCFFTVTVFDNEKPCIGCDPNDPDPTDPTKGVDCDDISDMITAIGDIAPDLNHNNYTHSGTSWDVTASDNSGAVASLTYSLSGATNLEYNEANTSLDGQTFNAGKTVVTWKAVDAAGNIATCSFEVVVEYPCNGTITMSSGHEYTYKRIGSQCWFTEDLREEVGDHHSYKDNDANLEKFGYLYSWYTAAGVPEGNNNDVPTTHIGDDGEPYVQGICPDGWSIGCQADYEILNSYATDVKYLKSTSTQYWRSGMEGETPSTGFDARGGGWYNSSLGRYEDLMTNYRFWTSNSAPGSTIATGGVINYYCDGIMFEPSQKADRRSVRCIRKVYSE